MSDKLFNRTPIISLGIFLFIRHRLFRLKLHDIVHSRGDFIEKEGDALFGALHLEGLLSVVHEGFLHLTFEREEEFLGLEVEDMDEESVAFASGDAPVLRFDVAGSSAIYGFAIAGGPLPYRLQALEGCCREFSIWLGADIEQEVGALA